MRGRCGDRVSGVPPGRAIFVGAYPALKRRAIIDGPSGTCVRGADPKSDFIHLGSAERNKATTHEQIRPVPEGPMIVARQ
jgi:hypothetical protein